MDITETFERKMVAIECHASQVENIRELAQQMSRCARDYGEQRERVPNRPHADDSTSTRTTYAEAFKVLRPFCDA